MHTWGWLDIEVIGFYVRPFYVKKERNNGSNYSMTGKRKSPQAGRKKIGNGYMSIRFAMFVFIGIDDAKFSDAPTSRKPRLFILTYPCSLIFMKKDAMRMDIEIFLFMRRFLVHRFIKILTDTMAFASSIYTTFYFAYCPTA